jgi:hypothetical protein
LLQNKKNINKSGFCCSFLLSWTSAQRKPWRREKETESPALGEGKISNMLGLETKKLEGNTEEEFIGYVVFKSPDQRENIRGRALNNE